MAGITTDAWMLDQGPARQAAAKPEPARLRRGPFSFSNITEDEVLAEPIYGCWEANMAHALERAPIDVCRHRGEAEVVIGNAGVVRILQVGEAVKTVNPGDLCIVFCNGIWDRFGYPEKILAYDAPQTMGVLAKRIKLHSRQVIAIPHKTRHSLQQWAAFSLRYITAWANWKQAYGCWRLQTDEAQEQRPIVWGWGGGVSLAELSLAKWFGCEAAMISSDEKRLGKISRMGITPIDRRQFINLEFDERRYAADKEYQQAYLAAEEVFLNLVQQKTGGAGVSIFADYIGAPVWRATLKALSRRGVITTAGWKAGMKLSTVRAIECMSWHTHVHTHYARYSEGVEAMHFAEEKGWLPPLAGEEYGWDYIPQLAEDYAGRRLSTYFPIFQVNPL
ncbi:MAG TPA: zinc-binding alcohol dehydrogenase family protein [Blastocatellia bacterium]|nr:zinc-binding alcohol dehydrogenase family protein [Blastocatellia bacterium]